MQLLQDAAAKISYQNLEKARSGVPDCGAVLVYSDKNTFYHRMLVKFEALGLPCGDVGGRTKRIENTDDKIRCINWIELEACLDRQAVTNMSHGLFDHVLENAENTSDCTTVFGGGLQTYSKKQKMSPGKLLIDNANHYLKESKFLESDIFDASDKVIKHWPHSQIRFEDGGQSHLTMHTGASEKAGTKTRESVDFVNNFTGSREATKVLSCFLNRQGWHDISTKMVNGNGDRVELHLDPADSSRSERQPVDRFRDAEIIVSKTDEGNYKVVFDWTLKAFGIKYHTGKAAYFGRLGGSDVDQGSTLLVEVNSEITISADAAKKGELKLLNEDFKHRFSESLVFDHNDEQSEHATSVYDDDSEVYLYQHFGGFGFISETFSDSEQD
ncbi:hypothetical protein OA90_26855 [Labrenzia sp. OB1]|nr:hypothetical protein OA90_26855 [Labrenzia sp. OB1]